MALIYDIPFEKIEIYLLTNNIDIVSDQKINYDLAYELILNHNLDFEIKSIFEWVTANKLLKLNINVLIYIKTEILKLTKFELNNLCKLLMLNDVKNITLDNIINILNYLGNFIDDIAIKIKNDEYNKLTLPLINPFVNPFSYEDILFEILNIVDFDFINIISRCSRYLRDVINSKQFLSNLSLKLKEIDTLNISNFTLKDICLFSKIVKNKEITLHTNDIIKWKYENINQSFMLINDNMIILTNEGKIYIEYTSKCTQKFIINDIKIWRSILIS